MLTGGLTDRKKQTPFANYIANMPKKATHFFRHAHIHKHMGHYNNVRHG